MLKIGIADYYLDNWHANYYPGFLREAAAKYGYDADIVSAYAFCDRDGGISTDEWCRINRVRRAASMKEMLAEADAVTVMLMEYGDGRMASFTQTPNPYAEFNFMVSDGTRGERLDSSDYYLNTMRVILEFFRTGIPPVSMEETMEILRLIDAAKRGRLMPDQWIEL